METLSDQNLVDRARNGDARAFECLVTRHYQSVYRVAYRWCGIREDAEDITQDVFVKVAGKIRTFKGRSAFRTWLYRVAMNTAMDFGRRRSARRAFSEAWKAEVHGLRDNPGEEAVAVQELYAAIDALPPRQKAAALLVWAEGFTHREAAGVLECAEATVSAHLFQAREKLNPLLNEKS